LPINPRSGKVRRPRRSSSRLPGSTPDAVRHPLEQVRAGVAWREEEESMRYAEHHDPETLGERAFRGSGRRRLDGAGEGAEAAALPGPERESED
jgi:hypothetical protein